jgi:ribosomal protein L40E
MRCLSCDTENPDDAKQCSKCGKSIARRPRRRSSAEEIEATLTPEGERCNAAALRAYHVCLFGLVPGLGLLLGPVSFLMGVLASLRGRRTPGFSGRGMTAATLLLSAVITATQWIGVALMLTGWRAAP